MRVVDRWWVVLQSAKHYICNWAAYRLVRLRILKWFQCTTKEVKLWRENYWILFRRHTDFTLMRHEQLLGFGQSYGCWIGMRYDTGAHWISYWQFASRFLTFVRCSNWCQTDNASSTEGSISKADCMTIFGSKPGSIMLRSLDIRF